MERNREAERDEIRTDLITRLASVLNTMFPAGKKRRGIFVVGDVFGRSRAVQGKRPANPPVHRRGSVH